MEILAFSVILSFISAINMVNSASIQSLLLNNGRQLNRVQNVPDRINFTANRQIIDLTRREIASHLLRNGGRDSDFEKPSTEFMMKVFEDLLNGKPLQDAVGHKGQRSRHQIVISDTVRSFSAKRKLLQFIEISRFKNFNHEYIKQSTKMLKVEGQSTVSWLHNYF